MKRISFIILFSSILSILSMNAQQEKKGGHHHHSFNVEKHHKEQADFFTKELNLTDTERTGFIPLMQEYIHARYALNREVRNAGRELRSKQVKTSVDYQKVIDLGVDAKIKEAELQKEYYAKFGKVISAEKVLKYHRAEKKFMQRAVRHHKRQKEER